MDAHERIEKFTSDLFTRWRDEHEHEDWQDYVAVAEKRVQEIKGATFVSLKRKPFELQYLFGGRKHFVHVTSSRVTAGYFTR